MSDFNLWNDMSDAQRFKAWCDACAKVEALRAGAERMSGWIKCSERMPEYEELVLVWPIGTVPAEAREARLTSTSKSGHVWIGPYSPVTQSARWRGVTHWRPLPEPPEGQT